VGDFKTAELKAKITHWFGDVKDHAKVEAPKPAPFTINAERRLVVEDDVQLPKVTLVWASEEMFGPHEAALDVLARVLTDGKTSRLHKRLVYDAQSAQEVGAQQNSMERAGQFIIEVTGKPGQKLPELVAAVDEEINKVAEGGVTSGELMRVKNVVEQSFYDGMEHLSQQAQHISWYTTLVGEPDYFERDLARTRNVTSDDVKAVAKQFLSKPRVVLSVVPKGELALAVLNPTHTVATKGGAK
jgi:predicted Zn-dependent peptidase